MVHGCSQAPQASSDGVGGTAGESDSDTDTTDGGKGGTTPKPVVDVGQPIDAKVASVDAGAKGQGDASPVVLMPAACASASPPKMGLALWLRAGVGLTIDNGRVSAWADQSGGTPAVQSDAARRPLVMAAVLGQGSKPMLRFEGGRAALQRDVRIDGLTEMTVAFVNATPMLWKPGNEWCQKQGCDAKKPQGPRVVQETGCSGTYQHVLWWQGTGDWTGVYLSPKQEEVSFRFGNGSKTYWPEPCSLPNDPWVAWHRPKSIGTAATYTVAVHAGLLNRLYVFGEKVSETPVPGGKDPAVHAIDRLDIGNGFGFAEGTNKGGDVGEVLVYRRALGDAELKELDRYVLCNLFPERL